MIWAKTNGIIKYRQTFQTNFHRTSPLKQKTTNNAHHLSHSAIYAQIYRPILRISRHFSPLPCASVAPLFTLFGTSLLPRFRRLCPLGIRRRLRYVLTIVARIRSALIRRLCPAGIRRRLRYVLTIVARIRFAFIRRLCPLGIRRRLRYVLTIVARIRSASRAMCSLTLRAYARLFSVPLRIRLCRQTLSLPSFFPIFTRTHTCGEACRSDVNAFLYSIQRLRRLRQNSGAK